MKYLNKQLFTAPTWAKCLTNAPAHRIALGNWPTPIFPFKYSGLPSDVEVFMKRDDYSGMEISGNKTRKLEFLLSEALESGADCVVTCGGIQSNHCRATAVAARMLGLNAHLLLRTDQPDKEPGFVGNLMLDRIVGAELYLLSREEYAKYGSKALIEKVCQDLREQGRKPYAIPVGGSNGLGTWGYVDAVDEMHAQFKELDLAISDVAFACGSGGSSSGMGLGLYLYSHAHSSTTPTFTKGQQPPVHAYSVCDSPDWFHDFIDKTILPELGLRDDSGITSREFLQITNAKGRGYAWNTPEELHFIRDVAQETGVVFDPVYSGKAMYHLIRELNENSEKFAGKQILFVHTGGLLGLYDKIEAMSTLDDSDKIHRLQINV